MDEKSKKKILTVWKNSEDFFGLKEILEKIYPVLHLEDFGGLYTVLNGHPLEIAAVMVDIRLLIEDSFDAAKNIREDMRFVAIPVIAISADSTYPCMKEALSEGITEYFAPPFDEDFLRLRLYNAIRSKDSATLHEIEAILKELPSNIYLKDRDGKYIFATQYWHHIRHGVDGKWTIRGKTDLDIRKDKENAKKAMESDMELIRTGKGTSYVIEENGDGVHEFLEIIKRPFFNENGEVSGIVALINNVTEQELLRLELEKRSKTDSLTGLMNKNATQELIGMMLEKKGKSKNKGALLMIDVDLFKSVNDHYGHAFGDRVLVTVGHIIQKNCRGSDVAGRIGGDEFMVFINDISDAGIAERFASRISEDLKKAFAEEITDRVFTLSIGIAVFPQDGKQFEELYNCADQALYYVKRHGRGIHKLYFKGCGEEET